MVNILAGMVLAILLITLYACLVVAGRTDDEIERHYKDKHDKNS